MNSELLLRVAKVVEPDVDWVISNGRVYEGPVTWHGLVREFNPLDDDAELMNVVFVLMDVGQLMLTADESSMQPRAGMDKPTGEMFDAHGSTKAEAILNLADKVLCNQDQ